MRLTFKLNDTILVFRLGTTSNQKIAKDKEKIVQTYSFSKEQLDHVIGRMNGSGETGMQPFFSLDKGVCFDCPFSSNSGNGNCYTHKSNQFKGFISMLKSIAREFNSDFNSIPELSTKDYLDIVKLSDNRYVRFGTYGEPTLIPIALVNMMVSVAKTYSGYSHQYMRKPEYAKYFMASTHNQFQANTAKDKFGYRSFIAVKDNTKTVGVICPASDEGGFKSTCSDCGLCSGTIGKGKKDVVILEH